MILPSEIYIQIIEEVGLPARELAYGLSSLQRTALCHLTFVDRDFYKWVIPVLYRSIHLTPDNISTFHCSLCSLKTKPRVLSLALTQFSRQGFVQHRKSIHGILFSLSSSLKRLLLDIELRQLYNFPSAICLTRYLQETLTSLPQIEELISVRDELYLSGWSGGPVCWPNWSNIKRIALYNLDPDENFISAVCHKRLESLYILNPCNLVVQFVKDSALGQLLMSSGDHLPSITIIDMKNREDHVSFPSWLRREWSGNARLRVVKVRRKKNLVPQTWYLGVALSGRLWEL